MADIKSYLQEKEKREKKQEDFKVKIKKHRLSILYRGLIILMIIIILAALVIIQNNNKRYKGYEVVSTIERETISGTEDIRLGNHLLTYSRDGAHCTDLKGNVIWNQTYEMQDVLLSICQNIAAIANYNGRDVYVVSESEVIGSFTTAMPIRSVTVAANGNVMVVMADTQITYFNIYSASGQELWNGQATMSGSGYPASISMSPDGELVQVAFIYLDAGVQKTNVAFYNLGKVGDNYTDNIVGVYTCTDKLIPYVQFMTNDTAVAVGDSEIIFYKGKQTPVQHCSYQYTKEVKSVFCNENYVGLVFYSDNTDKRYNMQVYNTEGKQVGTYYFDVDYTDLFFGKKNFTAYNDLECVIITLDDGVEKFHGNFNQSVRRMLPAGSSGIFGNSYKYAIVTNESIDIIQLK